MSECEYPEVEIWPTSESTKAAFPEGSIVQLVRTGELVRVKWAKPAYDIVGPEPVDSD